MAEVMCMIEHHAALYGFIAKEAIEAGLDGRRALSAATTQYGRERGGRMAEYAKAEGMERTMPNYSLFKEWRPPHPGECIPGDNIKSPHYVTSVVRCEWAETWKKYDVLQYAKTYCLYTDKALVKGFNEELELDIPANLSFGDDSCVFSWGYDRTPEIDAALQEKAREIGLKYVKDFNFQTAHLYCCLNRVLREELPETGEEICRRGVQRYRETFGQEYLDVLKETAAENGWEWQE
ncbi:MAG: L-2-amino-thiazoline-4-carboxylic acid hydrolase [Lachnospiraceae bacterium]|nr:L-2-amino-thiazoline-4-carboxylic acid hydrolase [Lachnospiraceae bacterium]